MKTQEKTQKKTEDLIGQTFNRPGRLPVLVTGYDEKSGKYRTQQIISKSHSENWLKKVSPANTVLSVGTRLTLPDGKKVEISRIEHGGCQLLDPEVVHFTKDELIDLNAEHSLGDKLKVEMFPRSVPRPGSRTVR